MTIGSGTNVDPELVSGDPPPELHAANHEPYTNILEVKKTSFFFFFSFLLISTHKEKVKVMPHQLRRVHKEQHQPKSSLHQLLCLNLKNHLRPLGPF